MMYVCASAITIARGEQIAILCSNGDHSCGLRARRGIMSCVYPCLVSVHRVCVCVLYVVCGGEGSTRGAGNGCEMHATTLLAVPVLSAYSSGALMVPRVAPLQASSLRIRTSDSCSRACSKSMVGVNGFPPVGGAPAFKNSIPAAEPSIPAAARPPACGCGA